MATAGTASVTTAETTIFSDADGCTSFMVSVLAGSSYGALVNIPGLHDSGEFFPIAVGKDVIFRLDHLGITSVVVKGDGGTADINYGIVARTLNRR